MLGWLSSANKNTQALKGKKRKNSLKSAQNQKKKKRAYCKIVNEVEAKNAKEYIRNNGDWMEKAEDGKSVTLFFVIFLP